MKRFGVGLMHVALLALVCAIGTYWAIRIFTPAPSGMPPPQAAAVLREPDPILAARMFGLVKAAPVRAAVEIKALGAFAAGKDSAAVLSVDGGPPRVYLLNQEVVAGSRLVEVRKDAVTIEQAGVRRDFALPPLQVLGMGGAPPPPGFRREGNTLTAPTISGAPQAAIPTRQMQQTRTQTPMPIPQPQQPPAPPPQAIQPDQSDSSDETPGAPGRRVAKGRALTQ
jgi:general secretion pathway protein C